MADQSHPAARQPARRRVLLPRHLQVGPGARGAARGGQRKDEFLATLSHELRNPLAPLRSSLERAEARRGMPAGRRVEIMERQLSHLVRLVDDLLEVSRITRGDVELRKELVRLDLAMRNAIEASEPLIRAGGHRLSIVAAAEPMMLDADPVRLAQIFGNLLNNAAKYSEARGQHQRRGPARGRRGRRRHQRHGRRHRAGAVAAALQDLRARHARAPAAIRAASASVSRWCAGWPRCTAAGSTPRARAPARAAASPCACRLAPRPRGTEGRLLHSSRHSSCSQSRGAGGDHEKRERMERESESPRPG